MTASRDVKKNESNTNEIHVVALALFNTVTKQYLLAQRGPSSSGAGEWEFPGGKIEPGETETAALVREINEELGFALVEARLKFVATHVHNYPQRKIRISLWRATLASEPVFKLVDHDLIAWLELLNIESVNLSEADKFFISHLKS